MEKKNYRFIDRKFISHNFFFLLQETRNIDGDENKYDSNIFGRFPSDLAGVQVGNRDAMYYLV